MLARQLTVQVWLVFDVDATLNNAIHGHAFLPIPSFWKDIPTLLPFPCLACLQLITSQMEALQEQLEAAQPLLASLRETLAAGAAALQGEGGTARRLAAVAALEEADRAATSGQLPEQLAAMGEAVRGQLLASSAAASEAADLRKRLAAAEGQVQSLQSGLAFTQAALEEERGLLRVREGELGRMRKELQVMQGGIAAASRRSESTEERLAMLEAQRAQQVQQAQRDREELAAAVGRAAAAEVHVAALREQLKDATGRLRAEREQVEWERREEQGRLRAAEEKAAFLEVRRGRGGEEGTCEGGYRCFRTASWWLASPQCQIVDYGCVRRYLGTWECQGAPA